MCGDVPGGEKLETVAAARVHLITIHLVHGPAVQHASNVEVQQRDQTHAHDEYPGVQHSYIYSCRKSGGNSALLCGFSVGQFQTCIEMLH